MEDNRQTRKGKALYERRRETIEQVFADVKEKHGMRFTRHNGLAKVKTQVLFILMVMNLKKLAELIGGIPRNIYGFFAELLGFRTKSNLPVDFITSLLFFSINSKRGFELFL